MKTEISNFCALCSQCLEKLPPAIEKAAVQFEAGGNALHRSLATLNDLRARLRSLTDKLESQHAYLLIFGPLKSGKSTLMNAISGAYVSEVTSLPGYPCLVFVQNADSARYSTTRYNARESVFANGIELKDVMEEAHQVLARKLRGAEERGEAFDPSRDFPEAIRRVDIKLPVPALGDSAMVLVDTPGLYSRMNFGYDLLTREFRDSAACAVFVVKTDNLFLDQVFLEFNQLLGLFSRIFIVVNVDTGKRDLAPDGSLRPSAESQNPERVVEAFKTLSMTGPLRAAYDSGRVRIHAVDLLNAASSLLSKTDGDGGTRGAFDAFQRDLLDYLNSTDYTREFIRDGFRQAQTLCGEMQAAIASPEVAILRARQEVLGEEIRALNLRLAAADRLLRADWLALSQGLRTEHLHGIEASATARTAQLREEIRGGFTRWMAGSDSLVALPHLHWNPALTDAARSLADDSRVRLERLAGATNAGLDLSGEMLADLQSTGFSPRDSAQRALISQRADDDFAPYKMTLEPDSLPVRKTLLDWLLCRGRASVRQRLFGAEGNREITRVEKEKRLRQGCRTEFARQGETAVRDRFPARPVASGTNLAYIYCVSAAGNIRADLRALRDSLVEQRDARQAPFDAQAKILAGADELHIEAERVAHAIERFVRQESGNPSIPPPIPLEYVIGSELGLLPMPSLTMLPLLGP